MNKIKFALVGCGHIGKRHVAVLKAEKEAELVAICDKDEKKCQVLSDQYGGILYFKDYDDMLEKIKVDVINIATPHGLHADMAIKALRKKINVLVEKPMALKISDCKEMINEAERNGVKLYVVKQNRYNVPISLVRKAIETGKLGKIFMVSCNVYWNRNQEYYEQSEWRGGKTSEGGSLYTQVSHFIDLLIWWFGDVTEAKSIIDTLNHKIEIEDCGVSALRFSSGVIGSLLWTTCVYNKNYEGSITIIGEKGTIKIGGEYLNKIDFWDVQSYPVPVGVNFDDMPNDYSGKYQGTSSNHDKVVINVIKDLLNERHDTVYGDEGMKAITAIEKIYNFTKKA
ncbi:MAG: Gfo/Idh/MocA family oxidoreductase [Microgenomates group bacterium]